MDLTLEQVRAAVAETYHADSFWLAHANNDSGIVVIPAILISLFGLILLLYAGSRELATSRVHRLAHAGAGMSLVLFSIFFGCSGTINLVDSSVMSAANVIVRADAYLCGQAAPSGRTTVGQLLDARARVEYDIRQMESIQRKLAFINGNKVTLGGDMSSLSALFVLN